MSKVKKPEISVEELENKAKVDPQTRNYNNLNSRKNLKQYSSEEDPLLETILPEVFDNNDSADPEGETQAQEIVRGRKLSSDLIKKLIPKRGTFTSAESKRFTGIVIQYLSDFKNEEPTASDVDDIFEIAKSDVMEMRLYEASKDPEMLMTANKALEQLHKRKQKAKENLASRRSDRLTAGANQDISIVDLVVSYDADQRQKYKERIDSLLKEESLVYDKLLDIIKKEV